MKLFILVIKLENEIMLFFYKEDNYDLRDLFLLLSYI